MSERGERFIPSAWKKKNNPEKKEAVKSRMIIYADSSLAVCKFTMPVLQEILGSKAKVAAATTYDELLQLALQGREGIQADGVLLDSTFENWHDYSSIYAKPKPMFNYKTIATALSEKGYRGPIVGLFGWEREDIDVTWYTKQVKRILVREDLEQKPDLLLRALGIG